MNPNARRNYDRMSHYYDLFAASEEHFTEIGLRMLNVQAGEKVLEIGFGTGLGLVSLARATGKSGKVYGIDISAGMLRVARARLARAGLEERPELHLGDALHLPFATGFFDALFISFTLELFDTPEIPLVLNECKQVLRAGGRLGIVALAKRDSPIVRLYEWLHFRFPAFLDCRPIRAWELARSVGFELAEATQKAMWGLPIEIVIARKHG